jgi:hypothetical protein
VLKTAKKSDQEKKPEDPNGNFHKAPTEGPSKNDVDKGLPVSDELPL